jgi:hypothetical protein
MKTATWLISAVILGCGILSGCSSINPAVQSQGQNQSNSSNPSTANSSSISNVQSANTVSSAANTSSSENSGENAPAVSTGQDAHTLPAYANIDEAIKQYFTSAKGGKITNIPFAEQSNMDAVYQAWGKRQETSAGAGLYTTYSNHFTAFGFNKGGQIFDLRSYSPLLSSITQSDITHILGKPGAIRYTNNSYIFMYPAGPNYQLLWVFQRGSAGKPMSYLDHISVFWPEGTINMMAQMDPAPSVIIDNAPGEVGSLFTFSIKNAPKNYHLSEFEWIPTKGTSIVNTLSQAADNAKTGSRTPEFTVSQDGKTMSFSYSSTMVKESGHVRVIYQNTAGSALIGESPDITLK